LSLYKGPKKVIAFVIGDLLQCIDTTYFNSIAFVIGVCLFINFICLTPEVQKVLLLSLLATCSNVLTRLTLTVFLLLLVTWNTSL